MAVSETSPGPAVGVLAPARLRPRLLVDVAVAAETAGLDEVWFAEDCFFGGGISIAAAALTATDRIQVGIGILPAAARNPAIAAMEIASLAGLYPGRFQVGVGHGMTDWMRQIGARPPSPVTLLAEQLIAIRNLLAGHAVTTEGTYVRLDQVRLAFPAAVPVLAGVRGPRSLRIAGEMADGTVLAEPAPVDYIRAARRAIDEGRRAAGRTDPHRVVAYEWFSCGPVQQARDRVRTALAAGLGASGAHVTPLPYGEALRSLVVAAADVATLADALAPEWIDDLSIIGSTRRCADRLLDLHGAGADSVILVCPPGVPVDQHIADAAAVTQLRRAGGSIQPAPQEARSC